MTATLLARPPWLVLGVLMGLVVVAAFALLNERVGVLGGFSDVVERVTGRRAALGWKAWFAFGIVGGALAFRLLAGGSSVEHGYGWLARELSGHGWLVGLVLVGAGALIGFGAKTAGGCTSGNGLGGCSAGSPASLTATATFMGTAVAVSFLIQAVI
ncbi:MAG TPA: YeeE/YedE thiosulfate transporter family protein [Thermoleophilaceae bacterium]|jgi:hypothetical protein